MAKTATERQRESRQCKVGIWTAIKRLWALGRCNHYNATQALCFENSYELIFCGNCGRVMSLTCEGGRRHNPHHDFDQTGDHLDLRNMSKRARRKIVLATTNKAIA